MTEARGEVYDLGYQHYEGPREGRTRARKALWVNGVRTALGLGRGSRSKILPLLLFIAAMVPAVVLALVASQVDEVLGPGVEVDIPSHADYYRIVSIILLIFSAIIAPELLCPDRRDGVLNLYLVRPLTPTDYVGARWLAFLFITLAIVYSGQVVLLIGFTLAAAEPLEYLRDNWLEIPRFLVVGIVVALFTTTLPMAVAAFTTRRAYAAAFVIGIYFISAAVTGVLTECQPEHGERSRPPDGGAVVRPIGECKPLAGENAKWTALIDIGQVPLHLNDIIFADESDAQVSKLVGELPSIVPIAWYLLLTAGPGFALLWRYRRIRI
ncbi:MAG: ABC transporter permease subunit [Dehalococcoidia bacterium]